MTLYGDFFRRDDIQAREDGKEPTPEDTPTEVQSCTYNERVHEKIIWTFVAQKDFQFFISPVEHDN